MQVYVFVYGRTKAQNQVKYVAHLHNTIVKVLLLTVYIWHCSGITVCEGIILYCIVIKYSSLPKHISAVES